MKKSLSVVLGCLFLLTAIAQNKPAYELAWSLQYADGLLFLLAQKK